MSAFTSALFKSSSASATLEDCSLFIVCPLAPSGFTHQAPRRFPTSPTFRLRPVERLPHAPFPGRGHSARGLMRRLRDENCLDRLPFNIPFLLCSRSGAGAALIQRMTHVPEPDCGAVVVRNLFCVRPSALPEESARDTVEIGRGRDVDWS